MSDYFLVIRTEDRNIFDDIVNGQKSVETRAATTKYKKVEVGDNLTFQCGTDKSTKTVTSATHYKSLDDLYRQFPLSRVFPSANSVDEAIKVHLSFPGYRDKLELYGVMAFELGKRAF